MEWFMKARMCLPLVGGTEGKLMRAVVEVG